MHVLKEKKYLIYVGDFANKKKTGLRHVRSPVLSDYVE